MMNKMVLYDIKDINFISFELDYFNINIEKRQSYHFQRFIAFELRDIESSFWKFICESIEKLLQLEVTPKPFKTTKIKFYDRQEDIEIDNVCIYQSEHLKNIGEIGGIRIKDFNERNWNLYFVVVSENIPFILSKYLFDSFDRWSQRKKKNEIYIFLSYFPIQNKQGKTSVYDPKEEKIYLIVDNIAENLFDIDISLLYTTEYITLKELKKKLRLHVDVEDTVKKFVSSITVNWNIEGIGSGQRKLKCTRTLTVEQILKNITGDQIQQYELWYNNQVLVNESLINDVTPQETLECDMKKKQILGF